MIRRFHVAAIWFVLLAIPAHAFESATHGEIPRHAWTRMITLLNGHLPHRASRV
jgi:hypothetical protein